MDIALAMLTNNNGHGVWRLQLTNNGESLKLIEIPDFEGDLSNATDLEKLDLILRSWGYSSNGATWQDTSGGWLVPVVVQHRV